jgi:hypothetical protein
MSKVKNKKKPDAIDKKLEGKKGTSSHPEVDILRAVHGYAHPDSEHKRIRIKKKSAEEMPPHKKRFERLETTIEKKVKYAKDRDKRWEPLGEPEKVRISANQWKVIQRANNLPQQLRRTEIITVERNSAGRYEVLSRERFAVDLATAELCEEKLQGFRLNQSIRFTNTALSLAEEHQKEVDKLGEKITAGQKNHLEGKYAKKIWEAREKCEKAIKDLDDIYKYKKLDSETLADLEQMEAKKANETDLNRRIKSVESKIAKNPEELRKNAQSIRASLDKMATLIQEIGPGIDASAQRTDQRSSADIISELKESLAKDNIAGVLSSTEELNRRFAHASSLSLHDEVYQDKMAELHAAHQATHLLFKKREISLDERHMLPLKAERYRRSQDTEAMFYKNQLLEHNEKIAEISGRLAAAQARYAHNIEESERIYKVVKTGGEPRPLIAAHASSSSTAEQTTTDLFHEAQRRVEQAHINILSLEQELAQLKGQEKTLQMQADLAKDRYDTNEARETIKRDSIHEFDKLAIQNKRKTYEEQVNNQRKLEILEINTLLLKVHTKNMFKAAALAAFMPMLPNTMQREATNQWGSLQGLMRSW